MTSTIITSPILGPLGSGESESWEVKLKGQREYNIFLQAHRPDVDFDLFVYDGYGNLIDMDDEIDSNAYCTVITYRTGLFQIVTECASGFSTYQLAIEEKSITQPQRKRIPDLF